MASTLEQDLALALELVDLADAITLPRFSAEDLVIETKPDLTPVTEADTAVEKTLRDRLEFERREDSLVGEEFGISTVPESSRRWIIDPIDGTKNYVRGIPVWGTLLALEDEGRIVLGVVSAPALSRRWFASRGHGAFMQERGETEAKRLRVSGVENLADAQLGFPGLDDWVQHGRLDALLELAGRCWRSRGFGDFWSYMLLAEGAVDVSCEPVVALWDLAAPLVIVEEAGGRFTDLGGHPRADGGDALATNGLLHEAALAIIGR